MRILLALILAAVVAYLVDGMLAALGLFGHFLALVTWVIAFFLGQHYLKELLE